VLFPLQILVKGALAHVVQVDIQEHRVDAPHLVPQLESQALLLALEDEPAEEFFCTKIEFPVAQRHKSRFHYLIQFLTLFLSKRTNPRRNPRI
jgi:hypothetical protein